VAAGSWRLCRALVDQELAIRLLRQLNGYLPRVRHGRRQWFLPSGTGYLVRKRHGRGSAVGRLVARKPRKTMLAAHPSRQLLVETTVKLTPHRLLKN
jgi:hypothetical protein